MEIKENAQGLLTIYDIIHCFNHLRNENTIEINRKFTPEGNKMMKFDSEQKKINDWDIYWMK